MTHPEDTATIERDLRAVDAALAADAAGHDDPVARELQELALALRADSARPEPAFANELRDRVEAGFPRPRPKRRWPATGWLLPSAAALATTLLVALAVVTLEPTRDADQSGGEGGGVALGGGDEGGGAAKGGTEAAPSVAQDDSGVVAPQPPPPGGGFAPGRRNRSIERTIAMTLAAPDEEIARVADEVTRTTGRHGGFVLRSDLNTGEDGASGSFELRIPTARLQPALRDLSGLATVRSQTQSGRDVTREHVTARDRLEAARAERRSLLRRLEDADTDEEAEAIRRRLDLVAAEINGLRGQLRDLRLRTDYAIVTVDLVGEDAESGGGGAGGSFDDALGDAGELLVGLAGVLVRVLAVALPLALIGLVGWLGARGFRRRRRESALA